MSCASSVTTHFQDAELFVPRMYPSVQSLHDTHDVQDPTFQPIEQQTRGPTTTTTTPSVLPPLLEAFSQAPADSKSITASHQQIDENRILKEKEKVTIQDLSPETPSMATLESRINQKTQVYSVRQISFENEGDTGVGNGPVIQKEEKDDEVARKIADQSAPFAPTDIQKLQLTLQNPQSNPAISEIVATASDDDTTSPLPNWIQEMSKPEEMPSVPALRRAVDLQSIPGAHAVRTSQTSQQTSQPSHSGTMNSYADDDEEAAADIQPHPPESLAEARPVADIEDDLPVATADNGNQNSKKRIHLRFHLLGSICVLLVVVGILVGAVCGTGHCSQKVYVDGSSTIAPTTTRDAVAAPEIETALKIVLGRDYFKRVEEAEDSLDVDLSEFLLETRLKAFDWIVNQDPMQLKYDSPNLVQRFLLVLFYYQTTRYKPWKECNPVASPQGSATTNLCFQPHLTTGEATVQIWGDQWLSASHECKWAGISCDETVQSKERTVVELRLHWNDLNGLLPWEMTRLSLLRGLRLSSNMLTGTLPPRLFSKKAGFALETLGLSSNQISGAIPAEWVANLLEGNGELAYLDLYGNTLTGKIPSELGQLPLKRLILATNTLTGSIPQEIFNQTSLQWLYLGENDLTGTLPSEVGLLTNLNYLYLTTTQISGTLPSEIGLATVLREIHVSYTNLQGTVPKELFGLTELRAFVVINCNFEGAISSSVGQLTRLVWLHLANNNFHGTIPNEIETLTQIKELLVNGNDLSGTVPVSFCQNLYAGEIASKVVADCLPNPETGVPAIQCPSGCCTSCCDKTGVCLAT